MEMWTHTHTADHLTNVPTGYRVQFDGSIITSIHASSQAYERLGVIVRALVGSIILCLPPIFAKT